MMINLEMRLIRSGVRNQEFFSIQVERDKDKRNYGAKNGVLILGIQSRGSLRNKGSSNISELEKQIPWKLLTRQAQGLFMFESDRERKKVL